jgi:integrase
LAEFVVRARTHVPRDSHKHVIYVPEAEAPTRLSQQLCQLAKESPKGGRLRHVTLTLRLAAASREHRHLRSSRVLCIDDGAPLTRQMTQNRMKLAAQRSQCHRAGVHILRHTFCSHLAMRGAPANSIQAGGPSGPEHDAAVHAPECVVS